MIEGVLYELRKLWKALLCKHELPVKQFREGKVFEVCRACGRQWRVK